MARAVIGRRSLAEVGEGDHDLIVIGGGIQGCTLAHEASLRGLRVVLLERDDFGGGTSWNSLRILHGGLRYLQTLDLVRFRESVRERRWYFRNFPRWVRPLPCVMPLYDSGLRRPPVLRAVLAVNDVLSGTRNRGVVPERQLPSSRVLDAEATAAKIPEGCRSSVRGGALWYDGVMLSPQRILIQTLHRATQNGAVAFNYVEAGSLLTEDGTVAGVGARDMETGASLEIRGRVVVNASGPASRGVARDFHSDQPDLFVPSLAFNLLLDKRLENDTALAAYGAAQGSQTFFLVPFHGRIMAGTFHEPVDEGRITGPPMPDRVQLKRAVEGLNSALPGLDLTLSDVVHVLPGFLPARDPGSTDLSRRPAILDHQSRGGPVGLWSVSGVKYTTARAVAEEVLDRILRSKPASRFEVGGEDESGGDLAGDPVSASGTADPEKIVRSDPEEARELLQEVVRREGVVHLDDLLLRRLDGLRIIDRLEEVGRSLCALLDWDPGRVEKEMARVRGAVRQEEWVGGGDDGDTGHPFS